MGETVMVLRPAPISDRYGGSDLDWSSATRIEVPGCVVAPTSTSEDNIDRGAVVVGLTLLAPPTADIAPTDRVEVRGVVYEVDGQPGNWQNPLASTQPGLEVALKAVQG